MKRYDFDGWLNAVYKSKLCPCISSMWIYMQCVLGSRIFLFKMFNMNTHITWQIFFLSH